MKIVILLAVVAVIQIRAAEVTCSGEGWVESYAGICYKFFDKANVNWNKANEACMGLGGTLAQPRNRCEIDWIRNYVRNDRNGIFTNLWIGGRKEGGKFVWKASDGTSSPIEYNNFGRGEPNNQGGSEDCITLFAKSFGGEYRAQWNDRHCSASGGYICQRALCQPW